MPNEEQTKRLEPVLDEPGWFVDPLTGEVFNESDLFNDSGEKKEDREGPLEEAGEGDEQEELGEDQQDPADEDKSEASPDSTEPKEDEEGGDSKDNESDGQQKDTGDSGDSSKSGPELDDMAAEHAGKAGEAYSKGKELARDAKDVAKIAETGGADLAADYRIAKKYGKEATERATKIAIGIFVAMLAFTLPVFVVFIAPLLIGGDDNLEEAYASGITTICLDPGHISENVGATSPTDGSVTEEKYNYMIATKLKPVLESRGYNVAMTKNSETEVVMNAERADRCADSGADLMYRIHFNSHNGKKGPFHMYPDQSLSNIYETSKAYTEKIQAEIVKELGISGKSSGDQPLDGGICMESAGGGCAGRVLQGSKRANDHGIPATLIEILAFDSQGTEWIKNTTNQDKMVDAIAKGIEAAIPPGSGSYGEMVVAKARTQLGVPYEWAACRPWHVESVRDGCSSYDCSGFAGWAWYWGSDGKVMLDGDTRSAWNNRDNTDKYIFFTEEENLRPGDLLYWMSSSGGHVGIYTEEDTYIHAPSTGSVIREDAISGRREASGFLRPVIK